MLGESNISSITAPLIVRCSVGNSCACGETGVTREPFVVDAKELEIWRSRVASSNAEYEFEKEFVCECAIGWQWRMDGSLFNLMNTLEVLDDKPSPELVDFVNKLKIFNRRTIAGLFQDWSDQENERKNQKNHSLDTDSSGSEEEDASN